MFVCFLISVGLQQYLIIEMMSDNCYDGWGVVNAQGWSQDEGEHTAEPQEEERRNFADLTRGNAVLRCF